MTEALPALPVPFRRQGQQLEADGECIVFFDCYSREQMEAFALEAIALSKESQQ